MKPVSVSEFRGLLWHELMNAASGRMAVVIGKGKSLDSWLAADRELAAPDAVFIGVNHACSAVPCHFGVTNHHRTEPMGETCWLESLPRPPKKFTAESASWQMSPWAAHWFLHVHGWPLLEQNRAQISDSRLLFNQHSSLNPAIHLAWYLGCSRLMLVGVDPDCTEQAAAVAPFVWTPPEYTYPPEWLERHEQVLRRQCDKLFPSTWFFYPRHK